MSERASESMSSDSLAVRSPAASLFAVERYDDSGGDGCPNVAFPSLPGELRLAAALYLPADQVVLALVEGPDEISVGAGVTAAGWRVDRITPASWLASAPTPSEGIVR